MTTKPKDFKQSTAELFMTAPAEEPRITPAEKKSDPMGREFPQDTPVPKGYKLVKENKSERLQLLIRPFAKKELKKLADAQNMSVNDLVNGLLEDYIERQGKE